MLTLMLLRHAKAVAHGRGDDYARELTDRGRADAELLGAHLAANGGPLPQFAFVSAAERTRQTHLLVQKGSGAQVATRFEESLYNATAAQLRDLLKIVDPAISALMVVGHNPGIMDVGLSLARDGDQIELARLRNRFPPGALAVITFSGDDWRDARANGGRLDMLLLPEEIRPAA